jgi:hypothetical protein
MSWANLRDVTITCSSMINGTSLFNFSLFMKLSELNECSADLFLMLLPTSSCSDAGALDLLGIVKNLIILYYSEEAISALYV